MILRCPVRCCERPLALGPQAALCPAGHRFDRARSGYLNLLQVQHRRSAHPGDPPELVRARRRLAEAGVWDHLAAAAADLLADAGLAPGRPVLDAGCGEGYLLRRLHAQLGIEPWGVDISSPAVDLAARALPAGRWIVANADRTLPFADHPFAAVLAVTARRNPPEYARLLAPGGRLLVGLAAPDDLAELRTATLGRADHRDRVPPTIDAYAPTFRLERRTTVRRRVRLDPPLLADLLATVYRAGRHAVRRRLDDLPPLEVTCAIDLLVFAPTE